MEKWNVLVMLAVTFGCMQENHHVDKTNSSEVKRIVLNAKTASELVELPLACIDTEYPNKLGQVIDSEEDLLAPTILHPAFYGCFDWHSAVHGHWSLVRLIKRFPNLEHADKIIEGLRNHLSKENIQQEIVYFKDTTNKGFERMYGWAWLLKLTVELHDWDHPVARELERNMKPLAELIVEKAIDFLPKLNYPIRVGTHTNTAFALSMIFDYAETYSDEKLKGLIVSRSKDFYGKDENCPLSWEPSGYDFLSPCLEEADLMRRVLPKNEFRAWLSTFLPQLYDHTFDMSPGEVSDREDGHLVHLDGLNFSRAWCLYGIAESLPEYSHLIDIANKHIAYSLSGLVDDSYEGGHWLASFALLALN